MKNHALISALILAGSLTTQAHAAELALDPVDYADATAVRSAEELSSQTCIFLVQGPMWYSAADYDHETAGPCRPAQVRAWQKAHRCRFLSSDCRKGLAYEESVYTRKVTVDLLRRDGTHEALGPLWETRKEGYPTAPYSSVHQQAVERLQGILAGVNRLYFDADGACHRIVAEVSLDEPENRFSVRASPIALDCTHGDPRSWIAPGAPVECRGSCGAWNPVTERLEETSIQASGKDLSSALSALEKTCNPTPSGAAGRTTVATCE